MNLRSLFSISMVMAALPGPLSTPTGAQTPVNSYTSIDLRQFGGASTEAYGLNDSGHVVGSFVVGGNPHAFLRENGVLHDLGTVGGSTSVAHAVNIHDQVVGWSYTAGGQHHAFLWDPVTGMRDLGTLGGMASDAYGINDAGQVVGAARNAAGTDRAFLWQSGRMYDLTIPDTSDSSEAYGINASGLIVGKATTPWAGDQAFLWTPLVRNGTVGSYNWLDSYWNNWANSINNAAQAVGGRNDWDVPIAVLWDFDGAHDLSSTEGYADALAINDAGTVVGYYGNFAYVWDGAASARDLNALAGFNSRLMSVARGINASGQIVANGAYLLSPSMLPSRPLDFRASYPGVSLTWSASYGADYYHVKRSSTSRGPYTTIAASPMRAS